MERYLKFIVLRKRFRQVVAQSVRKQALAVARGKTSLKIASNSEAGSVGAWLT